MRKGEKSMRKDELKAYAKSKGVFLWELAEELGMCDTGLSKKLRHISDDEYAKYISLIDHVYENKNKPE